jgi:hypothetical protein
MAGSSDLFKKAVDDVTQRGMDIFGIGTGFFLAFLGLQVLVFILFDQNGSFNFILISATLLGGILGFLFGVPKTSQDGINSANTDPKNPRIYLINSNLNQVSDWLTKIIIGATLINFNEIIKNLYKYSLDVQTQLNSNRIKQSAIAIMIIGFVSFGFLAGYMITRVIWSSAFARADAELDTLKQAVEDLKEENTKLNERLSTTGGS